jgi:hypothetical protein
MGRIRKNITGILIALAVIGLSVDLIGCASNDYQSGDSERAGAEADSANARLTDSELAKADIETLKDVWLKNENLEDRNRIVREFEKRKSIDGLQFCLLWTTLAYSRSALDGKLVQRPLMKSNASITKSKYSIKESIDIIFALAETRSPEAIEPLTGAARRIQEPDLLIAVLQAFAKIKSPTAVSPTAKLLKNPDPHIRILALDTLGQIKSSKSLKAILPALYDNDARIRWKAVNALGELGDQEAAGHISFLLGDTDKSVRTISEITLKKLGVPEEKIDNWKNEAGQVSIEDIYRSKLAYQRAEIEKQELAKKLESEKDLKTQLEDSLKNKETALEKQKNLVESLYDKERELRSKLDQLDIAKGQSGEYQEELEQLNIKVQALNEELKHAKGKTATANLEETLNKTLQEKSQLETDIKMSQEKESKLQEEIVSLSAVAEQTRIEADDAKKQLAAMRDRETDLVQQVDRLKERLNRGMTPVLVVSKPEDQIIVRMPTTMLHAVAVDDKGISDFQVTLNGQPLKLTSTRGIKVTGAGAPIQKNIAITEKLQLAYGQNIIELTATDTDGTTTNEIIRITREKEHGDVWAAVIGINQYTNARPLKYAVNDALAFKQYLKNYIGMPEDHIFFLSNQNATRDNIQSLLGTKLKRKASKEDTVIIFYAGHGAVETDPSNPDGDGFEKYLLPYDANLNDLYTTSISMDEVRKIFQRIRSDRLIFIADTCYSGASGGRTMVASKTRANLSDKFYERISKGKGRVIISSCSANEISKEDDNLQHGIFSYYMLEGLKGRADQDGDGIITVSELFSYISRKVPEASAQDQHPVKKGETEGELVIGRVK